MSSTGTPQKRTTKKQKRKQQHQLLNRFHYPREPRLRGGIFLKGNVKTFIHGPLGNGGLGEAALPSLGELLRFLF